MYSGKENSIALISMPWAPYKTPSLALGQLKSVLSLNAIHCQNFYCSNNFYKIIFEIHHERKDEIIAAIIGAPDSLLPEWFFSRCAFGIDSDEYIKKYVHEKFLPLRELFEKELEKIAQYDWSKFQYIGFTCTFNQIVSSLALSRRIKELHPDAIIILGGDRIDSEIAYNFIRKFRWIDWVVVGEGERSLIAAIKNHQIHKLLKVPGVASLKNRNVLSPKDEDVLYESPIPLTSNEFDDLPIPDFNEFYAENSSRNGVWELSRGCWYGNKNPCSFCGLLTDDKYKIRSNPIKILEKLKSKYDIEHLEFVDLLMPTDSFETVFKKSNNLHMTFECSIRVDLVKYNEIHRLKTLAQGGVTSMFVGIESLHPKILKMMRKGHLASHCVSFMKWAKYYGIRIDWFLLFGVPFEKSEYYIEMLTTLKQIPHLPPPGIQPIMITKTSPYSKELRPLKVPKIYSYIYPEYVNLEAIAYDFDFLNIEYISNKGKNYPAIREIISYVEYWNNIVASCSLTMRANMVLDKRHSQSRAIRINDEQVEALNFCSIPQKLHEVQSKFSPDIIQNLRNENFLLKLDERLISLIEPQAEPPEWNK